MDFSRSLYPETKEILRALKRKNSLGIFSEGYKKFQITKLKNSGLYDFFDRQLLFIFRRKTQPLSISLLPKGAVLVDDKLEVLERVYKKKKNYPCLINRKQDKKHPLIKTIYSLKECLLLSE